MTLPGKLYKRLPDDPKLYDDAGNMIEQRMFYHRFNDKSYVLIWGDKLDGSADPFVYVCTDTSGEYIKVEDIQVAEDVLLDFKIMLAKPDHTDGPVWYYERNTGIPMFMNKPLKNAQDELNKANNVHSRTGDKFCRNCGTVFKGTEKFCRECGSPIISSEKK